MRPRTSVEDLLDRLAGLIRVHRSDLVGLARAEGMGPEDAVDCLQEALCSFLDAAARGVLPEADEDWSGLLAGMVRNVARNGRRRHFRSKPHDRLDDHPLTAEDSLGADELVAQAEQHIRLRECVEELCEIQRAVVTLRMLEEQPGDDVAKDLGITAGHVAVLLHRAKVALRACMTRPGRGGMA
jgi:RNA polymerase sigma-70 factor (ECF subfamily)